MNSEERRIAEGKTNKYNILTIIKPLRILQFLIMLLLFTYTIYVSFLDPPLISRMVSILLLVVTGVYVFVLAIEFISLFAGTEFYIVPMVMFSLFGLFFFGFASTLLIASGYSLYIWQIVLVVLSIVTTLLFLLDIAIIFTFWRKKSSICRQCCSESRLLAIKGEEPYNLCMPVMKFDTMTSVSDIRVSEDGVTPLDRSYRKVGQPRRRQYVDCPTCIPSLCNLEAAQIQTEPKKMLVVESQTPKTIMKEIPIQTLSTCEFCERRMQPFASSLTGKASAQCFQHSSQWAPAIVQFVRGGVNMPCCPGCKCMQQRVIHRRAESVSHTLQPKKLSATQQVARPSCSASSYSTPRQAAAQDTLKIRPATSKGSSIDGSPESRTPEKTKTILTDRTSTARKRKELLERRSRGGGEEGDKIYPEFTHMMVREDAADIESRTSVATQVRPKITSPVRTKSKTFLHLKTNKVDPVEDINMSDDNGASEEIVSGMMHAIRTVQKNDLPKSLDPVEPQNTCRCESRKSSKSVANTSKRYTTLYMSNISDEYYCEFCRPYTKCRGSISKNFDVADLKKLRCASCKYSLYERCSEVCSLCLKRK